MKNAILFFKLFVTLLGYGLIIGGFIVFGESIPEDVRYLDMVVTCLLYTQLPLLFFFPLINYKDESHKEVGSMGIQMYGFALYTIAAILVIILGLVFEWSFKIQLFIQIGIFFLLILSILASLFASSKVSDRHQVESKMVRDRAMFKMKIAELMDEVVVAGNAIPLSIRQSLEAINDTATYLVPSSKPEASMLEDKCTDLIDEITVLLRNVDLNQEQIAEKIKRLELTLSKRKNY